VALNQRGDKPQRLAGRAAGLSLDGLAAVPEAGQGLNATHWSLLPLYPMQRWGWGWRCRTHRARHRPGACVEKLADQRCASVIGYIWLAYVIYSWVGPQILRKLI